MPNLQFFYLQNVKDCPGSQTSDHHLSATDTALVQLLTTSTLDSTEPLLLGLQCLHLAYPCQEDDHGTRANVYAEMVRTRAAMRRRRRMLPSSSGAFFEFALSSERQQDAETVEPYILSTISKIRSVSTPECVVEASIIE
ncbi:unnamed protein product [Cyclocybe aegerita]|uniref:Uncharacterized protein n=1 Tax=Cyclocybe aegerita TaxID=1973307 RepID=A0A8S0XJ79_CYCAE|nr:unnamed protein product [Cyclocybe aegerita]